MTTNNILVTGGTGTLGRAVVDRLLATEQQVTVLSRRPRGTKCPAVAVDLRNGEGLDAALTGQHTIVHCATTLGSADIGATRNVIEAAKRAEVAHLVYISIVGIDRVPLGYYKAKLATEQLIEGSGVPYTILRTTQFHDLLLRIFTALAKSPVMPLPSGVRDQPIDVGEVADRLGELAVGQPAGRVPDMGGPEVRSLRDLARSYLLATRRRRLTLPVPLPGAAGRGYRAGGHLAPDHAVGRITFDEFLRGASVRP